MYPNRPITLIVPYPAGGGVERHGAASVPGKQLLGGALASRSWSRIAAARGGDDRHVATSPSSLRQAPAMMQIDRHLSAWRNPGYEVDNGVP